jgi:hypothetical protein
LKALPPALEIWGLLEEPTSAAFRVASLRRARAVTIFRDRAMR